MFFISYIYCGLHYAERVTVAQTPTGSFITDEVFSIVSYAGKRVASYAWIAGTDVPVFQFEFDFDRDGSYGRRQLQNLEFPF